MAGWTAVNAIGVCPAMVDPMAGAAPPNGTWVRSRLKMNAEQLPREMRA
jgi:hypothetical protein